VPRWIQIVIAVWLVLGLISVLVPHLF